MERKGDGSDTRREPENWYFGPMPRKTAEDRITRMKQMLREVQLIEAKKRAGRSDDANSYE